MIPLQMISNYFVHYSLGKRCSLLPWTNFNATVTKQISGARAGATATTNQWSGPTFGNSFSRDFDVAKTFQSKSEFEDFKAGDFIMVFPCISHDLRNFWIFLVLSQSTCSDWRKTHGFQVWSRRGSAMSWIRKTYRVARGRHVAHENFVTDATLLSHGQATSHQQQWGFKGFNKIYKDRFI